MAKSYERLFGVSDYDERELFSVQEVAEFICEEGKHSDVSIYQENGALLLNTFGLFLNKITDMENCRITVHAGKVIVIRAKTDTQTDNPQ